MTLVKDIMRFELDMENGVVSQYVTLPTTGEEVLKNRKVVGPEKIENYVFTLEMMGCKKVD